MINGAGWYGIGIGILMVFVGVSIVSTPHYAIRRCLADGKVPRVEKNELVCVSRADVEFEESLKLSQESIACSQRITEAVNTTTACLKALSDDTLKKQAAAVKTICERLLDGKLNAEFECWRGHELLHTFPELKRAMATGENLPE